MFGVSAASLNPSILEVRVETDAVRMRLEIDPSDVEHFADLLDAERYRALSAEDETETETERRRRFFSSTGILVLAGPEGAPLPGRVVMLEERERAPREAPLVPPSFTPPPRDERVLYVELEYPLASHPTSLSLVPPLLNGESLARVNIGFITLHLGTPLHDFRYLSRTEGLDLRWDDPWYSRFRNSNLRRHHQSPILVYVYVDDFEVRLEILARLRDLEPWLELELRDANQVSADERSDVGRRVGAFLAEHNPMTIDGEPVTLGLDQLDYVNLGLRGMTLNRSADPIPMGEAFVGVILSHPTEGLPQEVQVSWDLFSETLTDIPAETVDPVTRFPSRLSEERPQLIWRNHLVDYAGSRVESTVVEARPFVVAIPPLSLLLAFTGLLLIFLRRRRPGWGGGGLRKSIIALAAIAALVFAMEPRLDLALPIDDGPRADPDRVNTILTKVLRNVYRAFEARQEGQVYDRLAVSVDGAPLQTIYLEQRRAFAMEQQGGAVARIDGVELSELQSIVVDGDDLEVRARWSATGTVGHWGHTHRRTNAYLADLTLSPRGGIWKLTDFEVVALDRLR